MSRIYTALILSSCALLVLAVLAFEISVWRECRTFGHGLLFCLALVSK
jgi:hypothetical protein